LALIVQKYGGTSVGDVERIKNVARRCIAAQAAGHDVVVVVSGMSAGKDKLASLPGLSRARWVELPSMALLQPGPSLARGLEELFQALHGAAR